MKSEHIFGYIIGSAIITNMFLIFQYKQIEIAFILTGISMLIACAFVSIFGTTPIWPFTKGKKRLV